MYSQDDLSCPIRTCLAAFCSRRHCQLLPPLQARTKPRRCSRMRKSSSSVRSRTIDTRRSLTETSATSPATANRSVTAAEQRRPLYVPNTKNNRNSTRPYLQNQQGSSNHDGPRTFRQSSCYRGTPRYRPLTARDVNGIDLKSFTKPPSH